jgi:hypothetical protein|tara:strand:- start:530 stop:784 length:255 start_codon:yes stop_codon:yes gene_type:complete
MAIISSYPTIIPTTSDLVVITDMSEVEKPTKTATIGSIVGTIADVPAPASATASGVTGQIATDANYIYVCTATDTWKRVAISTW